MTTVGARASTPVEVRRPRSRGTAVRRPESDRLAWLAGLAMAVVATGSLFIPRVNGPVYLEPSVIALVVSAVLTVVVWTRTVGFVDRNHLVVFWCLAGFIPGLVLSGTNSYAQTKFTGLVVTAVVVVIAMQLLEDERRRKAFLVATTVLGLLVTVELFGFGVVAASGRTTTVGLNEIGVGRMGTLAALVILVYGLSCRGRRRLLALLVAGVVAFVATSTGSRGPILAAIVAVLVTALVTRSTNRLTKVFLVAGIGAAVFTAVRFLGDPDTADRLLSTDDTNRGRIWAESLQTFFDHPFGIGFGNLYQYITVDESMASTGYNQYSHNTLLEAASEGGITALLGLVGLLIFSFLGFRLRSRTIVGELMLAVFVYAVANALLSSDLVGSRLMWVMIGAGSCLVGTREPRSDDETGRSSRESTRATGRRSPDGSRRRSRASRSRIRSGEWGEQHAVT